MHEEQLMSVQIIEKCVTCGACLWECPTEAIAPGMPRPVVEENLCTECYGFFGENQCMVVCPVDAFVVHLESLDKLAHKYKNIHPARPAQDTWIWQRLVADVKLTQVESEQL